VLSERGIGDRGWDAFFLRGGGESRHREEGNTLSLIRREAQGGEGVAKGGAFKNWVEEKGSVQKNQIWIAKWEEAGEKQRLVGDRGKEGEISPEQMAGGRGPAEIGKGSRLRERGGHIRDAIGGAWNDSREGGVNHLDREKGAP